MSQQLLERLRKEGIEVKFRKSKSVDSPGVDYERLVPDTVVLPKGARFSERGIPIPCDIVYESDVAVKMRDGVSIYTDIYRPTGSEKVPAIIAWGNFGKKASNERNRVVGPKMFGLTPLVFTKVSGLEKFEGPDPAYWCNQGYAVVNPDARGAYNSEGDVYIYGSQEGEDGHDLVEWLAKQEWCNGKVGMVGNSWLAITQWFIAAERPPHLAAIAPWEGFYDLYRDSLAEGGIPGTAFEYFVAGAIGKNRTEDVVAMIEKYPLMNSFWKDKAARLENIEIPAYVVASWFSEFHTPGTVRAFEQIPSKEKWLRIHNTQEWVDHYTPENMDDLKQFFDRYLRGMQNGWEKTPRVRLSIINQGGSDEVYRPENEFPLARTQYKKLFLNTSNMRLSYDPIDIESKMSYKAEQGRADFTLQFNQTLELTGYIKLHLWVEAAGSKDMDLFVNVQKLDSEGRRLGHNPLRPYMPTNLLSHQRLYYDSGPVGMLRVSHRRVDPARSTDSQPFLTHDAEELLDSGQIVPIEVPFHPVSMLWQPGEQLRLSIAGYQQTGPLFFAAPPYPTRNKGEHIIYSGGKYDSHLLIPIIPR